MLTITEVTRTHAVSTRMLRYYEQQGLLCSQRREGYAYRVYDEENIARLRLILVLRKLRIPLKRIKNPELITGALFLMNVYGESVEPIQSNFSSDYQLVYATAEDLKNVK